MTDKQESPIEKIIAGVDNFLADLQDKIDKKIAENEAKEEDSEHHFVVDSSIRPICWGAKRVDRQEELFTTLYPAKVECLDCKQILRDMFVYNEKNRNLRDKETQEEEVLEGWESRYEALEQRVWSLERRVQDAVDRENARVRRQPEGK